MTTVRAAQLIYTRVEPAYSPQMKSGFQTVYRSTSLSPTDVNVIEKRVQCFQPNPPTLVRFQFFTLDSGGIVLTNSIQIDSHPEIIDKDQRRGVFIAHCLILSKAEFAKADYNPFVILDRHRFLDDAEDMVRTFGQATADAPPALIEIERPRYSPPSAWSGTEALKVAALAMRGEQLRRSGKSVLLVGSDDEISEALRMVFYLLPKSRRLACTFDTLIDRCPTRSGLYWAVGTTTRQSSSSYILVNTTERKVLSTVEESLEDEDLYLTWLKYASSQADFQSAMGRAFTVQLLTDAFAVKSQLRLDELDEEACHEFMRLHEQRVMQDLENVLAKAVGKGIAAPLTHHLHEMIETPTILNIAASQHLDPVQLCAIVTDWIVREKPDLKDKEWEAIQDLARRGRDMRLLHLSAVLGRKVNAKVRDEALGSMGAQTFQAALEQLMDPIEPADFVTLNHLPLLLSDHRLDKMTDEKFVALVMAIVEVGAASQLNALSRQVKSLANEPLAQLEKIIKKHANGIPEEFKMAVVVRREEIGERPGLLSFLRK
jgi:hypothetical protein